MNYFSLPEWAHSFLRKVEDIKGVTQIYAGNELFYALMRNRDLHYIKDDGRPRVLDHPLLRDHHLGDNEVVFYDEYHNILHEGVIECD